MESFSFFFMVILAIIMIAAGISSIVIVRQKTAVVLERFGKFCGVLGPGFGLKLPWPITTISGHVSLRIEQIQANVDVKTKDNLFVSFPTAVQFYVAPDAVEKAHYELSDPTEQIQSYIFNTVRSECAKMTFEELYTERTKIEETVLSALKENIEQFGYTIRNVLVDEPRPSDEVKQAIEAEKVAEREKAAAIHEAEAHRIRVEANAAAEAESKRLQGQGIADMRHAIAQGFSESIREINQAASGQVSQSEIISFLLEIQKLDTQRDVSQAMGEKGIVVMGQNNNGASENQIASIVAALQTTRVR